MNKMYKKLNTLKEAGIWFNRVPYRPGAYSWESIFEGKRIAKGALFWHCVRNTWNYVQTLKQQV